MHAITESQKTGYRIKDESSFLLFLRCLPRGSLCYHIVYSFRNRLYICTHKHMINSKNIFINMCQHFAHTSLYSFFFNIFSRWFCVVHIELPLLSFLIYFIDYAITVVSFFSPVFSPPSCTFPPTIIPPS